MGYGKEIDMDYKKLAKSAFKNAAIFRDAGDVSKAVDLLLYWKAINDLLTRLETAEERCKRLNEARERANEAAAKWEGMYRIALEQEERAENGRNKGNVMVCQVCNGSGKVHTGFYGLGSCSMADVMNDKFPPVCRTCKGKGIIEVNEFKKGE